MTATFSGVNGHHAANQNPLFSQTHDINTNLYYLFLLRTDKSESILCQKGKKSCENIVMHQENNNKWLFFLLDIESEAFKMEYKCEFTVKKDNLDSTSTGSPTILLPGMSNSLKD